MLKIVKVLDNCIFICKFASDSSAERGATATRTASVRDTLANMGIKGDSLHMEPSRADSNE